MRVRHSSESYIEMVNDIHGGKYDYSETVFTSYKEKITVICPAHGEFYPKAGNHKKTGCPSCYNSRRGESLRTTYEDYATKLSLAQPMYRVSNPETFQNASSPTKFTCVEHGEFSGLPTRVLSYKYSCPGCEKVHLRFLRHARNSDRIANALTSLPRHIHCLSEQPGWGRVSDFLCEHHGPFHNKISNIEKQRYFCNECAKDHFRGVARVPYEEYASYVSRKYPKPPVPFRILEDSYHKNIGTKLVHLRCDEHGDVYENRDTINNGRLGTPCPYCKSKAPSTPELELVEFIRSHMQCLQGDRKIIAPRELDVVIPNISLAIEFCGLYWHSDAKLPKDYHLTKLLAAQSKGYRLLQIFEDEWLTKKDICKAVILNHMGLSSRRYYARKLSVQKVNFRVARDFLIANHLQGFTPAQHYYALYDQDVCVAMSSFSYNRLKKDGNWELVRYCSTLGSNVVGGLSKLVSTFCKVHSIAHLISYCCRRWYDGAGYKTSGFTLIGETSPTYFYTKAQLRLSRHVAQKHKLHRLLPQFDANMSEFENMSAAGFNKIYDCGNLVFKFDAK